MLQRSTSVVETSVQVNNCCKVKVCCQCFENILLQESGTVFYAFAKSLFSWNLDLSRKANGKDSIIWPPMFVRQGSGKGVTISGYVGQSPNASLKWKRD